MPAREVAPMQLVLVEEDHEMRAFVCSLLTGRAVAIVEADDPENAPAIVAETAPDLVLLAAADLTGDLGRRLPGLLRQASPMARLLVLGAPRARQASDFGVDGLLPYPFNAEQLDRAIEQLTAALT